MRTRGYLEFQFNEVYRDCARGFTCSLPNYLDLRNEEDLLLLLR